MGAVRHKDAPLWLLGDHLQRQFAPEYTSAPCFLYWEAFAWKTNVNCTQKSVLSEVIDFLSGTSPLSQIHYNSPGNGWGPRTTLGAVQDPEKRHDCSELVGSPLATERCWASLELESVPLYPLPRPYWWHRYPLQKSKCLRMLGISHIRRGEWFWKTGRILTSILALSGAPVWKSINQSGCMLEVWELW